MSLLTAGSNRCDTAGLVDATGTGQEHAGEPAPLELRVTRPGTPDRRLRIGSDRCTLGSGEGCTVRLADSAVRPLHAVILTAGGRVLIRGYAIPIEINTHFALEAFLQPGDAFCLGPYRFEILSVPATAPARTESRQLDNGFDQSLRSQWVRTQQRLEALTQRYQQTLDSLEQAREEAHQARRRIESLQQECRDRADLQAHQNQAHAEEIRHQADQVTHLQFEVLRLREELEQTRERLEQAERDNERLLRNTTQLTAAAQSHEADRLDWERRLSELTDEVLRHQAQTVPAPREPAPSEPARPDSLPVAAKRTDSSSGPSAPTPPTTPLESVEHRMNRMLGEIGKLIEDPEVHFASEISKAKSIGANAAKAESGIGKRSVAGDDASTGAAFSSRDATRSNVASTAWAAAEQSAEHAADASVLRHDKPDARGGVHHPEAGSVPQPASLRTARPSSRIRAMRPGRPVSGRRGGYVPARFERWQLVALPAFAAFLFLCGYRNPDLALVWNVAGCLALGLAAFFLYDVRREISAARWKRAITGQP